MKKQKSSPPFILAPLFSVLLMLLMVFSSKLYADRIVTSVSVDGSTQTTVTAGSSVNVVVNVTTTGNRANARWRSTSWILSDGTNECVNHGNFNSSGAYSVNFNIAAPSVLGEYDLSIRAYRDDGCSQGQSATSTLNDAIRVNTVNSFTGTNYRDFSLLYGANLHGDMKIFGNTILGERQCLNWQWQWGGWGIGWIQVCASYATVCPAANTNNAEIQTRFWDVDGDASTFNSSSSQLIMPAGSVVKKAYLYWQGLAAINEFNSARTIKFKPPGGGYISFEAPISQMNWSQYGSYFPYQAKIEITEHMNGAGEYAIADLTTTEGQIAGLGTYGAWSIVVVYENLENTMKNISIYDGYQAIDENNEQEITLSGFMTPTTGVVNSKFLVFTGEGDVDISGDYVEMDGTKLRRNDADGGNNAFNASVTDNGVGVATRSPSCQNNLGIDIHTYNVGTMGQNIIGNNQTSTTVKLGSSQDMYFPSVFAFSTELYVPDVCYEEYITKDGQTPDTIKVGDLLDIEVYITNKNFEPAKGVSIKRMFNTEYEYERNSTQVYEGGSFQANTDAAGDDVVLYDEDEDFLLLNLGQGATADSGGIINLDQNETFAFQFTPGVDGNISSAYLVSYRDESGVNGPIEEFNNIPIGKCSNRDITETIIPVEPSGNARIVESGKNWNDFNGGLFTKVVGLGTTYDILFATDDSGAVLTNGEIAKIELIDIFQGNNTLVETVFDGNLEINQRESFSRTFNSAYQRVQFRITLASGDVAYSNDFSVRPAEFKSDSLSLWAGEVFNIDADSIKAVVHDPENPYTENPSAKYNTTLNKNHIELSLTDPGKVCTSTALGDVVESFGINFNGGSNVSGASSIELKDIGNFQIKLTDSTWAASSDDVSNEHCILDSDTNELDSQGRLGCSFSGILPVVVKPYELNITRADYIASTGSDWLYMADVSDMNVTVSAIVQANNKQHQALQNFDALCYASDVNLSFKYSVVKPNSVVNLSYIPNTLDINKSIDDINKTITISASDFSQGLSSKQYSFNINRSQDTPLGPVDISLEGVEVASTDVAKDENNATVGINKTFLYGRLRAYDVETSMRPEVEVPLFIEVYGSFGGAGQQNTLNWYTNKWHTNSSFGELKDINSTKINKDFSDIENDVTRENTSHFERIVNLTLKHNFTEATKRTIHLDISPWLWHLPGDLAEPYDYNASSTCKEHPCFEFYYNPHTGQSTSRAIHSGEGEKFGGSDFEMSDANQTRQGAKVFR
jgi:hypothetical protein